MNPGYLTLILASCCLVLIYCGWRTELAGQVSGRKLIVLFIVWLVSLSLDIRITPKLELNGSSIVAAFVAWRIVYRIKLHKCRNMVLIIAVSIALWHACIAYTHRWSAFSVIQPFADLVIGEAMIAGLLLRHPLYQLSALLIGIGIGGIWEQTLMEATLLRLGSVTYWDQWWAAFLLARAVSLVANWLEHSWLRLVSRNK